jgi:hypothetical protein
MPRVEGFDRNLFRVQWQVFALDLPEYFTKL